MRWIAKKRLAVSLTLLAGVTLAGSARALLFDGAGGGNDLVRSSRSGRLASSQIAFHRRPVNDVESAFSYPISAVDGIALGMWSEISDLQSHTLVRGDDPVVQASRASHTTIGGFDGGHFSIPSLGGSDHFSSRRKFCPVVPEPNTFGLLGGGLVGLAWLGRRSRRRAEIALPRRLA